MTKTGIVYGHERPYVFVVVNPHPKLLFQDGTLLPDGLLAEGATAQHIMKVII